CFGPAVCARRCGCVRVSVRCLGTRVLFWPPEQSSVRCFGQELLCVRCCSLCSLRAHCNSVYSSSLFRDLRLFRSLVVFRGFRSSLGVIFVASVFSPSSQTQLS